MNRKLKTDKYGNVLLSIKEGKEALLRDMDIDFAIFNDLQEIELFNKNSEQVLGNKAVICHTENQNLDVQTYHNNCATDWNIPELYKNTDIKELLLLLCNTKIEEDRVKLEFTMFKERGLVPLLQFLFYIVDYMRKYKIVWGVGRGSSVASYCLYLLGVHKVDSLKYQLPIEEFLK